MLYLDLGHDESWSDVEGRPLGERACRPERRGGVPMKMSACPYPGLRFRHPNPMNASALQQFVAHWPESMGVLASLRTLWLGHRPTQAVEHRDVWRMATLALAWPGYLVHRFEAPVAGNALPVVAATVFKIAKGIAPVAKRLALADVVNDGFRRPVSGLELWRSAELQGALLGSDEVCAGPDDLIREALGVLVDGDQGPQRPPLPGAAGTEGLCLYAATQINVAVVDDLYQLVRTLWLHDFRRQIEGSAGASSTVLAAFAPAFAGMLKGEIPRWVGPLPTSDRRSKLETLAAQVVDDDASAVRWPLAEEVRALIDSRAEPVHRRPAAPHGAAPWAGPLEELRWRMDGLDAALLRAYRMLCGRLRDALGHPSPPPPSEINLQLVVRRHGPELRQAMEIVSRWR